MRAGRSEVLGEARRNVESIMRRADGGHAPFCSNSVGRKSRSPAGHDRGSALHLDKDLALSFLGARCASTR
jgi:hypothetical protein